MADGIFQAFGSYGWIGALGKWIGIFVIFLIIALILTAIILALVVALKSKKAIEVSQINKRIKTFTFREKKSKKGLKLAWLGRYQKFIPKFQERDVFTKGKRDFVFLLKDNNGLHHTLRIPNYAEIKIWYKNVYGINLDTLNRKTQLTDTEEKIKQGLGTVFMIPNPSEDLEWLASQIVEAKKEFAGAWWQSPTVMVLGTAALCVFMFIINFILMKKL